MSRRTIGVLCALAAVAAVPLAAQQVTAGEINAAAIGKDQAQQLLKEVSVTKFEDSAFWRSAMSIDDGLVTLRRLPGAPAAKKPIPDEATIGLKEQDAFVLGVKVDFFHRGLVSFTVRPAAPLPIEGISKTISVWAAGRNFNHVLKVLIEDYFGRHMELTLGKLTFVGWKKLTVAVPPSITQTDYHFAAKDGIKVIGFRVDCDLLESQGTYYLYLDDLRAVTDLFGESRRDADDMADGW